MFLTILFLPLLGSFVSGFLGRKIGVTGSHLITCSCLILSAFLSSIAFYQVGFLNQTIFINLGYWLETDFFSLSWEFLFDQLTVAMFIPVLFISSLIHIFSIDYMKNDPHNQRFFAYLSLFTFFMLILLAGANYFVMFVGWEGIGVVSYLLINFWFTRIQANKAAILALNVNRVGDMGLSIGFFALISLFGSLDYSIIYSTVPFMNETAITIIALLLLSGAMAKSSQIPLHNWLIFSMEGSQLWINKTNNLKLFLFLFSLWILNSFFNLIGIFPDSIFLENLNFSMIFLSTARSAPQNKFIRFIRTQKPFIPLPAKLKEALIGELLGDGCIRFTGKGKNGVPGPNRNAIFAMTLKYKEHARYLWQDIYNDICTSTPLRPWPNPNTGKIPTQYTFSSRALPSLTILHKEWYVLNKITTKFTKIVPLNIGKLLTPIGLAHWLMGDSYWDTYSKTVCICTDSFTLAEVELLVTVLKDNFNLVAGVNRRIKANKEVCWRIRFSSKSKNIPNLISIVKPYFIPSMYYKLNIIEI
jgi:hypothetical protein